ncbi:hypothetical protein IU485_00375 [Nocardia cyriacigeorgica]|nr:hypothetical protein [Nocardia cyriacigeorgica]MBF6079813.1 hypothetical protein [Nocardia cyriacigeorgica]BDT86924.1 hypothetical protein FMUAM8_26880 [Nocardia cyriacigeorgica]
MQSIASQTTFITRLTGAVFGAVALAAVSTGAVAAAPPFDSGSAAPIARQQVELNDYCEEPGAVAQLADGRTVYCTQVSQTDAYVWSLSRNLRPHDPNMRDYTCDDSGCHYPDGSDVPGYKRCGLLCGEPPTSGDVQSGLYDCVQSGVPFEECEARLPRG